MLLVHSKKKSRIKKYFEKMVFGKPGEHSSVEEVKMRHLIIQKDVKKMNPTNVIEVGCGGGFLGKTIISYVNTYIGLDISQKALKIGKKLLGRNASFILCDAELLPLRSKCADITICSEVLEHLPNYKVSLNEMHRVLRLKGKLIVTTPNLYNPSLFLRVLLFGKGTAQVYDRPIPYPKLIKSLNNCGFKIRLVKSFFYYYPGFYFMRKIRKKVQKFLFYLDKLMPIPIGLYLFIRCEKQGN